MNLTIQHTTGMDYITYSFSNSIRLWLNAGNIEDITHPINSMGAGTNWICHGSLVRQVQVYKGEEKAIT